MEELHADVPVFLYHGSADEEVPLKHMELYAEAIAHARACVLADRDHKINNDLINRSGDPKWLSIGLTYGAERSSKW